LPKVAENCDHNIDSNLNSFTANLRHTYLPGLQINSFLKN
jgi:hypothetical protein